MIDGKESIEEHIGVCIKILHIHRQRTFYYI